MAKVPSRFWNAAYEADAWLGGAGRRVRGALGLRAPLRILPYRGFGTAKRVVIKARVLEEREMMAPEADRSLLGHALASYRRYATREMPGARVRAIWGDRTWEGVTDEEGFLDLWGAPPAKVEPGWHEVRLELVSPESESANARVAAPVLVTGSVAEYGVISDIDDTVIETGVTNPLKRAWALFMTDAQTRLPFEGVEAFYGALRAGASGEAGNPIFYVSSSPYNLYEHLDWFMRKHEIPSGPLLLRDWGLTRHGFAPGGGHGHKLEKIRLVLELFPDLAFVLIGDSGQEDAEHYTEIARAYPGRVRAIYIRNVAHRPGRDRAIARLAESLRGEGVDLLAVDDTLAAARHAAGRGWIRWAEIPEIVEQRDEDVRARGLLDSLDRPQ